MGLITPVLCLVALVSFFLMFVRKLLTPLVPVKGTTNVPGPIGGRRWPIFGDALWFAGVRDMKGMLDTCRKLARMRNGIISFWMGSKLVIMIYEATLLKKVIDSKKCPRKEEEFYSSFAHFTDGVFATNNLTRWSKLRRSLDKFLLPKRMDDYMEVFTDKAGMTCDYIQKICGKGVLDVKEIADLYMLNIVLEIFLGIPSTQQFDDSKYLIKLFGRMAPCALLRAIGPLYKINWIFHSSPLGRETQDIIDSLKPPFGKIVDDCLKKMKDRGYPRNDFAFEPQNYLEAVIDFEFQQNSSKEKMMSTIYDVLVAGYDTTGVAIASAILFLAMHPEYQEKAYQEQLILMGGSLEAPTRTELSKMEYLDMAFNETLRKVMVPGTMRILSSELEIDGYVLPEGSTMFLSLNLIANDPQYWENPDGFYPDHFLPENVAKRPECSFTPFAFGTRGCPGRRFSLISSKLIISMLLRRFKFTSPLKYNEITHQYGTMVQIVEGYPIEVTPRPSATTNG
ncbi:hypothetical protein GE061_017438 [Apolygus lucorum]|uniref:Uncharacterized protein n=1 Tax=Apolygus lucorum TaxID=248454 RepID=A0A6A4J7T3_APOLU|nr:hypothetical protein GE061_017438 [Apolygus lucorum]